MFTATVIAPSFSFNTILSAIPDLGASIHTTIGNCRVVMVTHNPDHSNVKVYIKLGI